MDLREFFTHVVTTENLTRLRAGQNGYPCDLNFGLTAEQKNLATDSTTGTPNEATEAWFCLALGPKSGGGWYEKWYRYPDQIEEILETALTLAEEANVYFSSYLFKSPTSTKENVLPSRTIQADLDDADILTLPLTPSILVQTSEGRHQGYWFLNKALDPEAHEVLSRKLTYAIPHCDTSGWPLGRKVRVPYTFNFKYLEGAQQIQIISETNRIYDESDLEFLVDPPAFLANREDVAFLDSVADIGHLPDELTSHFKGPQEFLKSLGAKLPTSVRTSYNTPQDDRSRALWSLLCAGFRAGLSREEVWWLAYHSANNKFSDLKYHGERELAKDVLRAETTVRSKLPDQKGMILEARALTEAPHIRRQHILDLIIGFMRESGQFIHTQDDLCWYVRSDLGRPVMISLHSEWLDMMLDIQFGLNGVEQEKAYVSLGLANFCRNLPFNGIQQALSYYSADTGSLMVHTGHKEVIRLTASNVQRTIDGSYGVVFPWGSSNEPFTPTLTHGRYSPISDWGTVLFGTALQNVIGVDPNDAKALLQVWLLFLLFRSAAVSRPILAFFGQPGAGKSTLFRRIYTLLYGKRRSVTGATSADNFDQSVSSDPFVVLDNVDRPETWLPDRLALSAASSDIKRRKLYTDGDDFILRRQALVGITAHNPHFNREDVADRLLLLTFQRLEKFLPEGDLLEEIYTRRNQLWGGILLDCQRVLQTPQPDFANVPQFRVEDFARTGYWIATALGIAEEFTSALKHVGKGQKTLNLENDHILVVSLQTMLRKRTTHYFQTASMLWDSLLESTPDVNAFRRVYRNPIHLGQKFWSLQDSLKEVFIIQWQYNAQKGAREWQITEAPHTNGIVEALKGGIKSSGDQV